MDFRKFFDSIDRNLLYTKLHTLGVPYTLCNILHDIYSNLKLYIKSGIYYSDRFLTQLGLPQGCTLSPLLFIIFASDLGQCFSHKGLELGSQFIPYLQFADDLAMLCDSAEEPRIQIDKVVEYCKSAICFQTPRRRKYFSFIKDD